MNSAIRWSVMAAFAVSSATLSTGLHAQQAKAQNKMSFFVTSVGSGKGGDLGGLEGADRHCQALAKAAGAGNRTWRAYLSTNAGSGGKVENARDRIGKGPWYNAKGELIASNVDELHYDNKINKKTALTEKGAIVNGVGDKPTMHDMLTGSDSQGRRHSVADDTTCGNWTSSGNGRAQLGHSDRTGLADSPPNHSWNMSHLSAGCSQAALIKTGGNALFYCFAAK
jgi:hypothetical protein